MTPAEKLEAAIGKLETLRRPGDEWARYGDDTAIISTKTGDIVGRHLDRMDGPLIVTLHRTIPAQIAILRTVLEVSEHVGLGVEGERVTMIQNALDLADAILEEDS